LQTPENISAAALERMMKLQDVILKAMAKKITWMAGAEIAGVTDRTMRRIRQRYQEFGYANNDAGLAAYPSGRWPMNCNHFQLVMLAYNLNCWLMLFNREEEAQVAALKHTTLATARLRFLFLAAKIWRHAGRVGVSYSDHYTEQGIFRRLMDRLRAITREGQRFRPVLATALKE
jgi:Transposase DDE domain group 1